MSDQGYDTYWCSRDTAPDGTLSELVDIWTQQPQLVRLVEGGFAWVGPGVTGMEHRYAQWTVAATVANCYTYPATSRECIRVG